MSASSTRHYFSDAKAPLCGEPRWTHLTNQRDYVTCSICIERLNYPTKLVDLDEIIREIEAHKQLVSRGGIGDMLANNRNDTIDEILGMLRAKHLVDEVQR